MTKPSTWRAFLWPEATACPKRAARGELHTGPSQPPDMPDRDRSTPYRPPYGISLPGQGSPQPEYPARVSDRPASPRRSGPTMRQQPPGSPTSPSCIAARNPQTRLHFPTFAQDVPLHGERPSLRRACSQTNQRNLPTDRSKAPSHTSRGMPAARKQARARERKNSGIFSPQLSPLLFPVP